MQSIDVIERPHIAIEEYGFQNSQRQNLVNKKGPVIVIEDDEDDQYMLSIIFKRLNYINKIFYFPDGQQALDYLKSTTDVPFLILSDINMPKLDGFALREKLKTDKAIQLRCIPYLFFSTAINQEMVIDAYGLSVQGFFVKPTTMDRLEKTISIIMEYWTECAAPNDF